MSGGGKTLEFWARDAGEVDITTRTVPAEEMLDVLDVTGEVTGVFPRSRVHAEGLYHHAVHVLVWDCSGRILLQKRAEAKSTCPGQWDTSVGGHVGAGEALLLSAIREAREELGISLTESDMKMAGVHEVNLNNDHERVSAWTITHEGPFTPDPAEVERVAWFDPAEVEALIERGECTPHFIIQWRAFSKGNK